MAVEIATGTGGDLQASPYNLQQHLQGVGIFNAAADQWLSSALGPLSEETTKIIPNPSHLQIGERALLHKLDGFFEQAQTPEITAMLDDMRTRIAHADRLWKEFGLSDEPEEQAAWRVAAFEGVQEFSDFDKTASAHDSYNVQLIPGSRHIEARIKSDRSNFALVYPVWQEFLRTHPDFFRNAGKHLENNDFRPGIKALHEWIESQPDMDLEFVSASFWEFVAGALERFGIDPNKITANTADDINATAKGAVVIQKARKHPNWMIGIIGDGVTDEAFFLPKAPGESKPRLDLRDVIGMSFALQGEGLANWLKQQHMLVIEYRDWNDIRRAQQRIRTRAALVKQQHPEIADYLRENEETSSRRQIA